MSDELSESLRRVQVESPVHGKIVVAEIESLRAQIAEALRLLGETADVR